MGQYHVSSDLSFFGCLSCFCFSFFCFSLLIFGFSFSIFTSVIPHTGQSPGSFVTTSGCMGQYHVSAVFSPEVLSKLPEKTKNNETPAKSMAAAKNRIIFLFFILIHRLLFL